MLIVAGSFEVAPVDRDAFIASRHEAMRISRTERGCIEYTFAADPLVPGRVVLYERWEQQQDLDDHLSAYRARAAAATPSTDSPVTVLSSEIVLYDISGSRPLG